MFISESVKSKISNLEKCESDFLSSLKGAGDFGFNNELIKLLEIKEEISEEVLINENITGNVAMCFIPNMQKVEDELEQSINVIEKISDKNNSHKADNVDIIKEIMKEIMKEMKSTEEFAKKNETENGVISNNSDKEKLNIKNDKKATSIDNIGQLIKEIATTKNGNKEINMQEIVSEIKETTLQNIETENTFRHNQGKNIVNKEEINSKNIGIQPQKLAIEVQDLFDDKFVGNTGIVNPEKINSDENDLFENLVNNHYQIEDLEYKKQEDINLNIKNESTDLEKIVDFKSINIKNESTDLEKIVDFKSLNIENESTDLEKIVDFKSTKIEETSGAEFQIFENKKSIKLNIDKIYESEISYGVAEFKNNENIIKYNIEPVRILENDVFEKSLIHSIKQTYENNSVNEITIKLKPDEYGAMTVKINKSNGNISARITTDNPFMESLLNSYSNHIIEKLSQQGIEIHEINILLTGNNNFFGNDANNKNQNENAGNEKITLSEKRQEKKFLTKKIKSTGKLQEGLNILA